MRGMKTRNNLAATRRADHSAGNRVAATRTGAGRAGRLGRGAAAAASLPPSRGCVSAAIVRAPAPPPPPAGVVGGRRREWRPSPTRAPRTGCGTGVDGGSTRPPVHTRSPPHWPAPAVGRTSTPPAQPLAVCGDGCRPVPAAAFTSRPPPLPLSPPEPPPEPKSHSNALAPTTGRRPRCHAADATPRATAAASGGETGNGCRVGVEPPPAPQPPDVGWQSWSCSSPPPDIDSLPDTCAVRVATAAVNGVVATSTSPTQTWGGALEASGIRKCEGEGQGGSRGKSGGWGGCRHHFRNRRPLVSKLLPPPHPPSYHIHLHRYRHGHSFLHRHCHLHCRGHCRHHRNFSYHPVMSTATAALLPKRASSMSSKTGSDTAARGGASLGQLRPSRPSAPPTSSYPPARPGACPNPSPSRMDCHASRVRRRATVTLLPKFRSLPRPHAPQRSEFHNPPTTTGRRRWNLVGERVRPPASVSPASFRPRGLWAHTATSSRGPAKTPPPPRPPFFHPPAPLPPHYVSAPSPPLAHVILTSWMPRLPAGVSFSTACRASCGVRMALFFCGPHRRVEVGRGGGGVSAGRRVAIPGGPFGQLSGRAGGRAGHDGRPAGTRYDTLRWGWWQAVAAAPTAAVRLGCRGGGRGRGGGGGRRRGAVYPILPAALSLLVCSRIAAATGVGAATSPLWFDVVWSGKRRRRWWRWWRRSWRWWRCWRRWWQGRWGGRGGDLGARALQALRGGHAVASCHARCRVCGRLGGDWRAWPAAVWSPRFVPTRAPRADGRAGGRSAGEQAGGRVSWRVGK